MLIRPINKQAITIQAEERLMRSYAFSRLLIVYGVEYQQKQGAAHLSITKNTLSQALFCQ